MKDHDTTVGHYGDDGGSWELHPDVSIRMTALNFAIMHGGPKGFTCGQVVECAKAFETFLKGEGE